MNCLNYLNGLTNQNYPNLFNVNCINYLNISLSQISKLFEKSKMSKSQKCLDLWINDTYKAEIVSRITSSSEFICSAILYLSLFCYSLFKCKIDNHNDLVLWYLTNSKTKRVKFICLHVNPIVFLKFDKLLAELWTATKSRDLKLKNGLLTLCV